MSIQLGIERFYFTFECQYSTNLSNKVERLIEGVAACVLMWDKQVCPATGCTVSVHFTCKTSNNEDISFLVYLITTRMWAFMSVFYCPLCSHTQTYETWHKTRVFPLKLFKLTVTSLVKLLRNISSTSPNSRAAIYCAIQVLSLCTQAFLRLIVCRDP